METIESLSSELLVKIFSYFIESEGHVQFLSNISPVCRKWNEVSATPSLWKSIEEVEWEDLVVFAEKGLLYHIESLKIPENSYNRRRVFDLSLVIPNICKLRNLDLSRTNLTSSDLTVIAKHCSHLEKLIMVKVDLNAWEFNLSLEKLDPVLAVCGVKLKHLDLSSSCYSMGTEELVTAISSKCPSLEEFRFQNLDYSAVHQFPLHKLEIGCPKLRKLEFSYCDITTVGEDGKGFKKIEVFRAGESNFHGLSLYSLLRNSTNLEHLELISNENLNMIDISDIPSDKLRVLEIWLQSNFFNMSIIKRAVEKWKDTLSELHLRIWNCNTASVLEALLVGNLNPRLESLTIGKGTIDLVLLKRFVERCQNLNRLLIVPRTTDQEIELFENREELQTLLYFL